jgi:hypothetical protein
MLAEVAHLEEDIGQDALRGVVKRQHAVNRESLLPVARRGCRAADV